MPRSDNRRLWRWLRTASTTGDWSFDHDTFQYNFQDGLDLLHSGMQTLSITNSFAQANEGQEFKLGSGDNIIFRTTLLLEIATALAI